MRRLFLLSIIVAAIGCGSSTGPPTLRLNCEDRFSTVWISAQTAVVTLGGKIIYASESSGTIHGRIEVDVLGAKVELNITVSRLPDQRPDTPQMITVTIKAIEPNVSNPDPNRIEELRRLEEQYLSLVGNRAVCGSPM
jgi:hypothetical protein